MNRFLFLKGRLSVDRQSNHMHGVIEVMHFIFGRGHVLMMVSLLQLSQEAELVMAEKNKPYFVVCR